MNYEMLKHQEDKKTNTGRDAFTTDTMHRLMVEVARIWVIDSVLRTGSLPATETRYAVSFDWGNAPGPDDGHKPLRGKRVKMTFEVEDW